MNEDIELTIEEIEHHYEQKSPQRDSEKVPQW